MRHTLALVALISLSLAGQISCLSVPEGQFPVHGADTGVIVHNYALAFRDFLRAQTDATMIPIPVSTPLPLTAQEWYADNVTSPLPVTTTANGVETTSRVSCSHTICKRTSERTFSDGFRLDETVVIYYHRGVTDTELDDRVLGFVSVVRYPDRVLSQSAATEPASGTPWVVTTEYGFSAEDHRRAVVQTAEYAELVSGAVPVSLKLLYQTKESTAESNYEVSPGGWAFRQEINYEGSRLVGGLLSLRLAESSLRSEQQLEYSSGVAISPLLLEGSRDEWAFHGETVALGAVSGTRSASGWERTIEFPKGQRFRSLNDQGSWPSTDNRGTFTRTIRGQKEVLTIAGTYRLKAPGVWELNASAEGGIRIEMTFQSLPLADMWQGTWVQANSRSSNLDAANFVIAAYPDWTSQMNYTYDRADTPFTPDESGAIRMMPDTRGSAKVSIVNEKSGGEQRHVDYSLQIVAEGQKP